MNHMPAEPKMFMWVQSDDETVQRKMEHTKIKKSKRVQQIQQLPKKKAGASSYSVDNASNAQCTNPQAGSYIEEYAPKVSQFYRKQSKDENSAE